MPFDRAALMHDDRSSGLYPIAYDERQEGWFVALPDDEPRLPLDRATLDHLVACYNEIHRGAALALLERRAMVELGQERRELEATVQSLYDRMDVLEESAPAPPVPGRVTRLFIALRRRITCRPAG